MHLVEQRGCAVLWIASPRCSHHCWHLIPTTEMSSKRSPRKTTNIRLREVVLLHDNARLHSANLTKTLYRSFIGKLVRTHFILLILRPQIFTLIHGEMLFTSKLVNESTFSLRCIKWSILGSLTVHYRSPKRNFIFVAKIYYFELSLLPRVDIIFEHYLTFPGSNPAGVDGFFQTVKTLSMTSFGRKVKPWIPCRRFTARQRTSSRN